MSNCLNFKITVFVDKSKFKIVFNYFFSFFMVRLKHVVHNLIAETKTLFRMFYDDFMS